MKMRNKKLKRTAGGKKWVGRRVGVGRDGWKAGKSTCFYRLTTGCYRIAERIYRLGPVKSTQVVDFPHIGVVSIFLRADGFATEIQRHRGVKIWPTRLVLGKAPEWDQTVQLSALKCG